MELRIKEQELRIKEQELRLESERLAMEKEERQEAFVTLSSKITMMLELFDKIRKWR